MTTETPSAPRTARARARAELTAEIKAVARRHLADTGAAALSLRAVARELGMVSSAVYRYFPSRDELLTALIVDAYDAVGTVAEATEASTAPGDDGTEARWLRLATAVRGWALDQPHEYALVYGSPVPGYAAPVDTVDPAARVALVFLRLVADGVATGEIVRGPVAEVPQVLHTDFEALRAVVSTPVPDEVLVRAMSVWAQLFGAISLELFGHLHNVVHDHASLFDLQMRQAVAFLSGAPGG